jgi:phosphatidyl-myo-inositol alpha-mannosyltransferase
MRNSSIIRAAYFAGHFNQRKEQVETVRILFRRRSMKILLSTPFDYTYPGGVNAHVANLDRELRARGHETRILSPGAPDGTIAEDEHVTRIGHAVRIPANGSVARLAISPFLGRTVCSFLEREQFDLLHLHDPLTSTLHLSVLAHATSAVVGTFHSSNTSYAGYNLLYRFGMPIFSRRFSRINFRIAVSPTARDFISHYFPGEYNLIPNGIDFERFGPHVRPDEQFSSTRPTVLFVGRFEEPRKGFRYLLKAMAAVQDRLPDAQLLVVGPGRETCFSQLIDRYRIRNVVFAGEVPVERLPSLYASCDVFCAPSTGRESFGIVLLEAMASGKPVVASDIAGYRSVIREGQDALLVEPRNVEEIGNAIFSVLNNSELGRRLGRAGRERARLCSWPRITQRVVECYERARLSVDDERPQLAASSSLFSSTRRP